MQNKNWLKNSPTRKNPIAQGCESQTKWDSCQKGWLTSYPGIDRGNSQPYRGWCMENHIPRVASQPWAIGYGRLLCVGRATWWSLSLKERPVIVGAGPNARQIRIQINQTRHLFVNQWLFSRLSQFADFGPSGNLSREMLDICITKFFSFLWGSHIGMNRDEYESE